MDGGAGVVLLDVFLLVDVASGFAIGKVKVIGVWKGMTYLTKPLCPSSRSQ